jgi:feruloyl-CoA synthase
MTTIRRRPLAFGPHDLEVTKRDDGSYLVRSPHALEPYPRAITDRLVHWAAQRPDRIYLADRTRGVADWRTITYAETLRAVRALAQALLDLGCTAERGCAILSENGIEHALLGLAAMYAGVPYAPISPAYATMSTDYAKLAHCLGVFAPAVVFAVDAERYAPALTSHAVDPTLPVILAFGSLPGRTTHAFETLRATTATAAVDRANAAVTPDTVAKILFTSGSTGLPKGVINTQRMLCSNQQMGLQSFPFWADDIVMVDWSPWNHTAGSNQTFNMVLYNGGTMYVDDGKPTPRDFAKTLRNLRGVSPTIYFNVPRGYDELARTLDDDDDLRRSFFRDLKMMWYAGAALSAPIFEHMRRLAIRETGEEILMTSGLGSTETAPSALFANFYNEISGNVGVPQMGLDVKLVPVNEKLELRVKGPSITPGYLHRDDLTAAAFDDEGYYMMGDGLVPVDPDDFSKGFLFDGRIGEDFKLATGTWVSVGTLRTAMIAELQPVVRDVVICGADQDYLSMLLVADANAAREVAGDPTLDDADAFAHPNVRAFVADRLAAHAARNSGSSTRVLRAIFLDSPPSIDAGEITDKGSLNNGVMRKRRAALIEHLYSSVDHPLVIAIA